MTKDSKDTGKTSVSKESTLLEEDYPAATRGPEAFGELADILDQHITPAYQGLANELGFGGGEDTSQSQGGSVSRIAS